MSHRTNFVCFLATILFVFVESEIGNEIIREGEKMMGIDPVLNIKIDKDTIITRNLKLDIKNRIRNDQKGEYDANSKGDSNEPDWSYSAIPNTVQNHAHDFKKNMSECLKEVQKEDTRPVKRLSPGRDSPVHGECLIACVLRRAGVIDKRKINKDNLINLVGKFYAKDSKVMKKLEKNLDRCVQISANVKDECNLATQLNACTNELLTGSKHKPIFDY